MPRRTRRKGDSQSGDGEGSSKTESVDFDQLASMFVEKMKESLASAKATRLATAQFGPGPSSSAVEEVIALESVANTQDLTTLSSSLDTGLPSDDEADLSKTTSGGNRRYEAAQQEEIKSFSGLPADLEKRHSVPPAKVLSRKIAKERKHERETCLGQRWYGMRAPDMTPELKRELQVLRMRNVLDAKRHYKASDWKKELPKFVQVGKVVESASDYYSGRMTKREQSRSLVDELLRDQRFKRWNKKRYLEIQKDRASGRKPRPKRRKHRNLNS